jgi:hypothetical protein
VQLADPRRAERLLLPIESVAKRLLVDCKMCGQCALSSTGMACPTNCAKQMRNGPCGGVRADGTCEVNAAMRCVWVEAIEGQKRIGGPRNKTFLEPIDHRLWTRSSWLQVIEGTHAKPTAISIHAEPAREAFSFEQACKSGHFVVTVEVSPPDSSDPAVLTTRSTRFRDLVDAINITDGAGANCHMSSAAAAAVLVASGLTPVAHPPAETATALRCKATFSVQPPWAYAIFFASPVTMSAKATILALNLCSTSTRFRCCA